MWLVAFVVAGLCQLMAALLLLRIMLAARVAGRNWLIINPRVLEYPDQRRRFIGFVVFAGLWMLMMVAGIELQRS